MSSLPKVLVFLGGESTEHEISLRSGAAVVKHLPAAGYEPVPVVVTRQGHYRLPAATDLGAPGPDLSLGDALNRLEALHPEAAFIAMHGLFGEDGRIQALCDLMHVPHVGADVIGSAAAMDKWFAKAVYRASGVPTPDAVLLDGNQADDPGVLSAAVDRLGLPIVVKSPRMGSSVGVYIAKTPETLAEHVASALRLGEHVLLETFRRGRELTVPVLEDPATGEPRALPVIEVRVLKHEFFDLQTKYDPSLNEELCPAPIPEDVAREVQRLGVLAHRALQLRGFSRTDFIWTGDAFWCLETNTIPGLTEASLFPKAAAVAGMSFPDLVGVLVRRALRS